MFDPPSPSGVDRQRALAELRRSLDVSHPGLLATATVAAAPRERPGLQGAGGGGVLPLAGVLGELFPDGGLPRGGVVALRAATGGASTALSLLLGAHRPVGADGDLLPGRWSALVGLPDLGLLAAAELGVDLDRLVLVPDPGPDLLQVLSVLADGVEVIATGTSTGARLPPAGVRVLRGRLRQHGAVLLALGDWPGADLTVTVGAVRWSGVGRGSGRLRDRDLELAVAGRRLGRPRTVVLRLAAVRTGDGSPGRVLVSTAPQQQRYGAAVATGTHGAAVPAADATPRREERALPA